MNKEERKTLVMTWTKAELDSYKDPQKFIEDCMGAAALRIGYYAIEHPNWSIQWVGNHLKENKKAETVNLYIKLIITFIEPEVEA